MGKMPFRELGEWFRLEPAVQEFAARHRGRARDV
jgi:hypothetical protein